MDNAGLKKMGEMIVKTVKQYVTDALGEIGKRLETVETTLKELPAPVDGKDGRDGVDGKDGADGKPGADGKSVDIADLETILAKMVADAVAAIPKAENGLDGRDALQIEILPSIDCTKSYPRGTYAAIRGGIIRAFRNTDAMPEESELEKCGWSVVFNGIHIEYEETLDEGRTIKRTTLYTDGKAHVREVKTTIMIYRGVWREGEFKAGDVATWGGSAWHCEKDTADKPGTSDAWRMMVKEGRAGKDGVITAKPKHEVVRIK